MAVGNDARMNVVLSGLVWSVMMVGLYRIGRVAVNYLWRKAKRIELEK